MKTEALLANYYKLKRDRELLQVAEDAAAAILIQELKAHGQKTVRSESDGEAITGTLVEGVRIVIDEKRLKNQLGTGMWTKVRKEVLDKDKLEARIKLGDIDPVVVAACSEEHHNKPYVKVTTKATRVTKGRAQSSAARRVKKR